MRARHANTHNAICRARSAKTWDTVQSVEGVSVSTSIEQLRAPQHPCSVRMQAESSNKLEGILPHLPQKCCRSARKCVGTTYKLAGTQTPCISRPGKGHESRRAVMQLCGDADTSATSSQRQQSFSQLRAKYRCMPPSLHSQLAPHTRRSKPHTAACLHVETPPVGRMRIWSQPLHTR